MIKRFLQTCAAAALMASSAFAANTGTFNTQTDKGDLTVEFHQKQPGIIIGTVHYANRDFKLVGRENQEQVNGHWEMGDQNISFTSFIHGRTMTLETNGVTYTLDKEPDATDVPAPVTPVVPQDVPQPLLPPVPQPSPVVQSDQQKDETREGRAFRYVVPAGWEARESKVGVDLGSPDGKTVVSHALLVSPGKSSPDDVMRLILGSADKMMWTNVKVESSTPCNKDSALGTIYNLNYDYNNQPVHAMVLVIVFNEANRNVARIVVCQTGAEAFSRDAQKLMDLAHQIVVTHPELVQGNEQNQQGEEQQQTLTPPVNQRQGNNPNQTYQVREQKLDGANNRFDQMLHDRFDVQPVRDDR